MAIISARALGAEEALMGFDQSLAVYGGQTLKASAVSAFGYHLQLA